MSGLHYYEIDMYCPATKRIITIVVTSQKLFKGPLVSGEPIGCSLMDTCKEKSSQLCLLSSKRIEARGRRML